MPYNVLNKIQNKAYFEQPSFNWLKNEQSQIFFITDFTKKMYTQVHFSINYALPLHKCFTNQWCNLNNNVHIFIESGKLLKVYC